MTSELPKRETRGTIVRGALAELKARRLFDEVRARVSPEVRAMMDAPPDPVDWVPSHLFDGLQSEIAEVAGRDTVREIAYALTRASAGAVVNTVIKAVFKVFGSSPVALLKRLNTVTHPQFRGEDHTYEPETERSGFVVLRHAEPVTDAAYAGWEGAYMYAKDMTGATDYVVGKFEISEDGKVGRVHVRW